MSKKQDEKKKTDKDKMSMPKAPKFNTWLTYGVIAFSIFVLINIFSYEGATSEEITQKEFLNEFLESQDVAKVVVVNNERVEIYIKPEKLNKKRYEDVAFTNFNKENPGPHFFFQIGDVRVFTEDLKEAEINKSRRDRLELLYEKQSNWKGDLLGWLIPIAFFVIIWIIIMRRLSGGAGGGGSQIFNIGKSKATLFDKDTMVSLTFDDVAGLDEAKEEVMEVVDFLKNPDKYTALGGKIPKGVLLVGPPGTGKTLLAKAMAGEAQVPFFSISGSDFVELFVGVGASRVRDLFKQAREKAPCIIFIDEIDAIGRTRGRNIIQGNDERENTLNQLLVEMDGFHSEKGVIILAATNRPDVLDIALMRPGRFDRQIGIDKPDLKGRESIFEVHLKPIKVSKDLDTRKLAAQTPGFAGADIANVCNEAALIGARKAKKSVDMHDFQDAIDRVIGGLEKKSKIISPKEKEIIAYHEAGHAVCGWFMEHADPLVKVSIVPRGIAALGYAQYLPKEQYLYSDTQLFDEVCMTLGGRAAEEITFGSITTGAQNDLEKITKLVYAMTAIYGMNAKVGKVSYNDPQNEFSFGKPYSEETAHLIDTEVKNFIEKAYERTKKLLLSKKKELEILAKELLRKEVLFQSDLEKLIGKRPFKPEPGALDDGVPEPKAKKKPSTSSGQEKVKTSKQANDSDEESKPSK